MDRPGGLKKKEKQRLQSREGIKLRYLKNMNETIVVFPEWHMLYHFGIIITCVVEK